MCCAGGRCVRAFAVVFLIISTIACIIHFISPYWTVLTTGPTQGLWGSCATTLDFKKFSDSLRNCVWFSQNDFAWEKALDNWQYACQGCSGFGVLFMLLALPIGCGSLCCCKSDRLAFFAGATTILAGILVGVAIGVWGYFGHDTIGVIPFVNEPAGNYEWGYYVGVGGVLLSWIAGGMFFCSKSGKSARY